MAIQLKLSRVTVISTYVDSSSHSELLKDGMFTTKRHQQQFYQLVQEWSQCKEEGLNGLLHGLTSLLGPLATLVLPQQYNYPYP